jgi:ComF family protein
VASFTDSAREAVHALKYHERHAISGVLGHLMAEMARPLDFDVVTHVPLHRSRRRERGYDQSWLLARAVARASVTPVAGGLKRTRKTKQQALLADRAARHANVAGAFEARHSFEGKTVLLVDDVTTTGSTLSAAAEALKSTGAASVIGLVFARAR